MFDTMSSESHMSSDEYLGSDSVWRYNSELKRRSKLHQTPTLVKDRSVLQTPCASRGSNFKDKIDTPILLGQPYTLHHHPESKVNVDCEITTHRKQPGYRRRPPRNSRSKYEEVVRDVSNVPIYLQNMDVMGEKKYNERPERWKHKERRVPPRHRKSASSAPNASSRLTNAATDLSPSHMEKGKDLHQRVMSQSRNSGASPDSMTWDGMTKKPTEKLQSLDLDFPSPQCPNKQQNIVLLFPKDLPRNSCSSILRHPEPREPFDVREMDSGRKSFSDALCLEVKHSAVLGSRVPHSCPLPSGAETTVTGNEHHSSMQSREKPDMLLEGKYAHRAKSKIQPFSPAIIETSIKLDQELADLTTAKGRNPSPNRHFSIGLGRSSRSFSSKEIPQLTNTFSPIESSPVKSKGSVLSETSNVEKGHAHSRGRSSPLRRLLDPLLKPKAARLHSADAGPVYRSLNVPVNTTKSVSSEKEVTSIIHALLQFTFKNGVPLFKFVVDDNECHIFATTVKKLTESVLDDSSWVYTFYAVREMKNKKSSGWMSQGNKGKGCSHAYNVVGQMKVSSSKYQNLATKSVLFGVELGHANREMAAASMSHTELAAIITSSSNREESDKLRNLTENGLAQSFLTDPHTHNTTVILADDIHGFPNEGAPSPLIDRWKSEGSCDCGGWDIGCKLRVLTSTSPNFKVQPTRAGPAPNGFNLFVQGGIKDKRPIFSLVPSKGGIYSVKFSSSISLLQAFSICVSVLNNEMSFNRLGTSHLSEAQQFQKPTSAGIHTTDSIMVQVEAPVKYAPMPPYSPVGRV